MGYILNAVLLSDEGAIRRQNEDNYYFFGTYREETSQNKTYLVRTGKTDMELLGVYDGMGGEEAGEVASMIAAKSIHPVSWENVQSEATRLARKANRRICDESLRLGNGRMGTTMACVFLDQGKAIGCNVGDSREYLWRDGKLTMLSKDHSEGQQMVDSGLMTLEQVKKSQLWHNLTQHLGIPEKEFLIEPRFSEEITIQDQDLFLLCSDGLTDVLSDEEIQEFLAVGGDLEEIVRSLKDKVFEKGAEDNVTILLARVEEEKSKGKGIFASLFGGIGKGAKAHRA